MSDFLVSLWESVFTPGTTPTLLIATNATFGCLQVLLLILLFFTSSYHFLFLSIICGGLWGAINWFAAEVQAVKAQEEKGGSQKGGDAKGAEKRAGRGKSPEQGSDTETENEPMPPPPPPVATGVSTASSGAEKRKPPAKPMPPPAPAQSVPKPTDPPSTLDPRAANMGDSDLLKRRRSLGESSGYISTDSEWEKVSEGEGSGKN